MANDYYQDSGSPGTGSSGSSATMRAEFAAIETGFDKLPALTANNNLPVFVNAAASGLEAVSAATALSRLGAQASDTDLTAIAALVSAADKLPYATGAGTWALTTFTAAARALLDDGSAAVMLATLGAAASGANIDITSVFLNNTGLKVKDTNASHGLIIAPGSDISADRTLTLTTGDASRTLTISASMSVAGIDIANVWTTQQNFPIATLTDAANIDWNLNTQQNAKVTLAGNRIFNAPTNMVDGGQYLLRVIQDGGGGRTATWNAAFKWDEGVAPTLPTTGGSVTIISFTSDGSVMHGAVFSRRSV